MGVHKAVTHLNFLGNISLGTELSLSISKKPVSSATLVYHLECASQKPKTARFFNLEREHSSFYTSKPKLCFIGRQPSPRPNRNICSPL